MSVVAVGGYGRAELSPHSDIDLLFVAPGSKHVPDVVSRATLRGLLYPLWDAGFQVGHAVVSPATAIDRTRRDTHALTAVFSARHVAGGTDAYEELVDRRRRFVAKEWKTIIRRIEASAEERRVHAAMAGWALAPNVKEDIGGLRDVHTAEWLSAVTGDAAPDLDKVSSVLLAVREALHGVAGRKLDKLRIDLQPDVARRVGFDGADGVDELMARVHDAARTIDHTTTVWREEMLASHLHGPRRSGSVTTVAPGVRSQDGMLHGEVDGSIAAGLRLIAAFARTGKPIAPRARANLQQTFAASGGSVWDEAMRDAFIEILAAPHCERALQLMDHLGAWSSLVPEWERVRGRPQHDPYHHYTVDGHSFLTVAMVHRSVADDDLARRSVEEANDLPTLLLAALLHDVGKGSGEDHSIAGERIASAVCARIGISAEQQRRVALLVRHHLLLADTATRRDLDDGGVIASTAESIGDPGILRLLYVLTAADGRATGSDSWSDWKASLARDLFRKTLIALETGELPLRNDVGNRMRELTAYDPLIAGSAEKLLPTLPPSYLASTEVEELAEDLRLLLKAPKASEVLVHVDPMPDHAAVTVCVSDRPGALARTAGVLALHRISVLRAQAYSTSSGYALQRFVVSPPEGLDRSAVVSDLEAAYSGRLALDARLAQKIQDYRPRADVRIEVEALQDASERSTVVEVRGPDALGLLYALTVGFSELDLDIHVAKIDTLGTRVVDVFYVRSPGGTKLDASQLAALEKALRHRVQRLFA